MTFWIASFPLSAAQILLHCWACRLSFNHPHVLRVVAEFLTANSPRPRGCFTAKRHLTLTQLAWRKTVHSLPHDSKFDFRPLFTYHEPTRGRVLVQLCAELVVFLGPISSRGNLTALISAFNIQAESPSQHRFSLQHSLSTLPMSFNWLTRSTASQAQLFPWKISTSANGLFRFPATSGWLLPETTLRFLN